MKITFSKDYNVWLVYFNDSAEISGNWYFTSVLRESSNYSHLRPIVLREWLRQGYTLNIRLANGNLGGYVK